jgi:phosphate starvation-inducible membrane PsiE
VSVNTLNRVISYSIFVVINKDNLFLSLILFKETYFFLQNVLVSKAVLAYNQSYGFYLLFIYINFILLKCKEGDTS